MCDTNCWLCVKNFYLCDTYGHPFCESDFCEPFFFEAFFLGSHESGSPKLVHRYNEIFLWFT